MVFDHLMMVRNIARRSNLNDIQFCSYSSYYSSLSIITIPKIICKTSWKILGYRSLELPSQHKRKIQSPGLGWDRESQCLYSENDYCGTASPLRTHRIFPAFLFRLTSKLDPIIPEMMSIMPIIVTLFA